MQRAKTPDVSPKKRLKSLLGNIRTVDKILRYVITEDRPFISKRERDRLLLHVTSASIKLSKWRAPGSSSILRTFAHVISVDRVDDVKSSKRIDLHLACLDKLKRDLETLRRFVAMAKHHQPRIANIESDVEKVIVVGPAMGRPPKGILAK